MSDLPRLTMPEGPAVLWYMRFARLHAEHCDHFLEAVEIGDGYEEHEVGVPQAIECGGTLHRWNSELVEIVRDDVEAEREAAEVERRGTVPQERWRLDVRSPWDDNWALVDEYRSWEAAHEDYSDLEKTLANGSARLRLTNYKENQT